MVSGFRKEVQCACCTFRSCDNDLSTAVKLLSSATKTMLPTGYKKNTEAQKGKSQGGKVCPGWPEQAKFQCSVSHCGSATDTSAVPHRRGTTHEKLRTPQQPTKQKDHGTAENPALVSAKSSGRRTIPLRAQTGAGVDPTRRTLVFGKSDKKSPERLRGSPGWKGKKQSLQPTRTFAEYCRECFRSGVLPLEVGATWPTAKFSVATYNSKKLARFGKDSKSDEDHALRLGIVSRLISADIFVIQEVPALKARERAERLCSALKVVAAAMVEFKIPCDPLLRFATWKYELGAKGSSQTQHWERHLKLKMKQPPGKKTAVREERHVLVYRVPKNESHGEPSIPRPGFGLPLIGLQSSKATAFSFNRFLAESSMRKVPPLCWDASTWVLLFSPDVGNFCHANKDSPLGKVWSHALKVSTGKGRKVAGRGSAPFLHVRIVLTSVHFPTSQNKRVQVEQLKVFFKRYGRYCQDVLNVRGPTRYRRTKGTGWRDDDVLHIVLGDFNCCPTHASSKKVTSLQMAVAEAGFLPTTSSAHSADSNEGKDRKAYDHILVSENASQFGLLHSFSSEPQHIDWEFCQILAQGMKPGDHEPVLGQGSLQLRALVPAKG